MRRGRRGRIARRLLRAAGGGAAGLVLFALVVALGLRTGAGRRAVLRLALPLVDARLGGRLRVRGLDGDLWRQLVLYDVRLDDAEGVEAFAARYVRLSPDWPALWRGRVHLRDLRVEGARLFVRRLGDGRLNLAALAGGRRDRARVGRASRSTPPAPPWLQIDHAKVQGEAAYQPGRAAGGGAGRGARGRFDLDGSVRVRGGEIDLRLGRLACDTRDPLRAWIELRGGLTVRPAAAPGGRAIRLEDVTLTVIGDGAELARLDPALRARGRWLVHVEGAGPLDGLYAHAVVSAPRGSVVADGTLGRTAIGLRWQLRAVAAGLDGAADWQGLPAGRIDFDVRSRGDAGAGELEVMRLHAPGVDFRPRARRGLVLRGRAADVLRAAAAALGRLRPP